MDKQIKQKWVEALRSGNYQQTQQCLKDEKGYCCLGVLAELLGWEMIPDPNGSEKDKLNGIKENKEDVSYMPFSRFFLEQGVASTYGKLVEMNDDLGYDFNQIADYIEENL